MIFLNSQNCNINVTPVVQLSSTTVQLYTSSSITLILETAGDRYKKVTSIYITHFPPSKAFSKVLFPELWAPNKLMTMLLWTNCSWVILMACSSESCRSLYFSFSLDSFSSAACQGQCKRHLNQCCSKCHMIEHQCRVDLTMDSCGLKP